MAIDTQRRNSLMAMKRIAAAIVLLLTMTCVVWGQRNDYDDGFTVVDNSFNPNRALDSLKANHKKVPKRLRVWTIDNQFGDIVHQVPDTSQYLFMNSVFTSGKYGEYNTTGNLGSPRIARIATDRDFAPRFAFAAPLSHFIAAPDQLRFTNTLSPITHLYYYSCGDRDNGEDWIKALFATNINKRAGVGFKFNYMYGRGFYKNQSTALFDYTFWASYLGPRYQSHFILSWDHMKLTENGGILDDGYVTRPEAQSQSYDADEIPTVLSDNWNRQDNFHATLSHRYNIGFYREVPMTEEEKEAKRFALRAQREKEEIEALKKMVDGEEKPKGRQDKAPVTKSAFGGRPADAKIVGDLPTDSLKGKKLAVDSLALKVDSLTTMTDSLKNDTSWVKEEYVPVTSFIHNLQLDNHSRTYYGYITPNDYYNNTFGALDDVNTPTSRFTDDFDHFSIKNNFAVGLLEGFNKYVPMGAKVFISNDLMHFVLPELDLRKKSYIETDFSAGVQVEKTRGAKLHYKATGEIVFAGANVGDFKVDATGDLNLPLWKDTVRLALKGFYHLTRPTFIQRHYHSRHFWWDNDNMPKQMQTHLEGVFTYARTKTSLRIAYDNLQNYVYLAESYNRAPNGNVINYTAGYRQTGKNISLLTIALEQKVKWGILNWDNRLTFQQSSDDVILAVPILNYWTNLYLNFKVAKVLKVHFGAEMFWFTRYNAPEYCGQLLQYAVQENSELRTKVGGYPLVNVYMNFRIKQCRIYVMMSHVNQGMGSNDYFLTPHHPLNERMFRFGLSWTFNN